MKKINTDLVVASLLAIGLIGAISFTIGLIGASVIVVILFIAIVANIIIDSAVKERFIFYTRLLYANRARAIRKFFKSLRKEKINFRIMADKGNLKGLTYSVYTDSQFATKVLLDKVISFPYTMLFLFSNNILLNLIGVSKYYIACMLLMIAFLILLYIYLKRRIK